MELEISRHEHEESVTLVCVGRLDAETGDDLGRAVAEELRRGHDAIRLDLAGTGFLSSAGIRCLFETQRAVKAAAGTLFVSQASDAVRKVLDLTRLTPLLMEGQVARAPARATGAPSPADVTWGRVVLERCARPTTALPAVLHGDVDAILGGRPTAIAGCRLSRRGFAVGLGALADGGSAAARGGELAAACGAVFHRPPHPHAAVDYLVPTGDLLADAVMLAGLTWEGLPSGQAMFRPADDEPAVRLDDLLEAVLAQTGADVVGVVVVGEIHGLVGAELIRPLATAHGADTPRGGVRNVAASWLSFSREPVYARHTALIVGVVARADDPAIRAFVRRSADRPHASHCHAVVFPYRPVRRTGVELASTVGDLAASQPDSVMHLIADPAPVLGSGRSELVRGAVWFAPLAIAPGETHG